MNRTNQRISDSTARRTVTRRQIATKNQCVKCAGQYDIRSCSKILETPPIAKALTWPIIASILHYWLFWPKRLLVKEESNMCKTFYQTCTSQHRDSHTLTQTKSPLSPPWLKQTSKQDKKYHMQRPYHFNYPHSLSKSNILSIWNYQLK